MIYRIDMNEKQLAILQTALESYFRTRTGQYWDLANDLAFRGFDYKDHTDEDFSERIARRDATERLMESAYRIAIPDIADQRKTEDMKIAIDMWSAIRHKRWQDRPEPKPHDTVDAAPAYMWSGEPEIRVEEVQDDPD